MVALLLGAFAVVERPRGRVSQRSEGGEEHRVLEPVVAAAAAGLAAEAGARLARHRSEAGVAGEPRAVREPRAVADLSEDPRPRPGADARKRPEDASERVCLEQRLDLGLDPLAALQVRLSSVTTSAITRPVTASTGTTTVCASRASATAAVSAFARRGERLRTARAIRPRPAAARAWGTGWRARRSRTPGWCSLGDRTPYASPPLMRVQGVAEPPSARRRQPGRGSRGEPAQAAMRALRVVLDPPVLDQHLRLEQAVELLDGQELVAQPAVERLHVRVLPRRTGLDVAAARAAEPAPVAQGVGRELWTVVAADVPRRRPAPGDDPVERGGGGIGVDAPGGHDRERLPRVLVDDVEQFQDPPVRGLVELEVERPDVVRPLGTEPPRGLSRVPQTLALASLHRDAQPLLIGSDQFSRGYLGH